MDKETNTKPAPTKVTQAQIQKALREEQLRKQKEKEAEEAARKNLVKDETLHENMNRLDLDAHVARDVDQALTVLGAKPVGPEKSLKTAYSDFEARRLPELKEQKPTLRLSQLKQLLKKEWQKSPENPLNEKIMSIVG